MGPEESATKLYGDACHKYSSGFRASYRCVLGVAIGRDTLEVPWGRAGPVLGGCGGTQFSDAGIGCSDGGRGGSDVGEGR